MRLCVALEAATHAHYSRGAPPTHLYAAAAGTCGEAQSNTKHEGGHEEKREDGGLLIICRLNKPGQREIKQAIFSNNCLFFTGCNKKAPNKGNGRQNRGKIYGKSQNSRSQHTSPSRGPLRTLYWLWLWYISS